MKAKALQELVAKVFSDEETKRQFESDPESVLSKYSLTEREKKAAISTYTKLGLISGNSTGLAAAVKPAVDWQAADE